MWTLPNNVKSVLFLVFSLLQYSFLLLQVSEHLNVVKSAKSLSTLSKHERKQKLNRPCSDFKKQGRYHCG